MREQEQIIRLDSRKFSNTELVDALRDFFKHKDTSQRPVLDTQIKAVLATYRYLLSEREHEPGAKLSVEETAMALRSLKTDRISTTGGLAEANADLFIVLADLLFQDIRNRQTEWLAAEPQVNKPIEAAGSELKTTGLSDDELAFIRKCTQSYISVLAFRLKNGIHVKDVFMELVKDYPSFATITTFSKVIAWALAYSGNVKELDEFIGWVKNNFPRLPLSTWSGIIEGAIVAENLQTVKDWWPMRPTDVAVSNILGLEITVLQLCIRTGDLKWGQPILNKLVESKLKQDSLRGDQMTMILAWAMAGGKSVDELEQMLDLLCSRLDVLPRTQDWNTLLKMAKVKNDPYYAERLFTLGRQKGIIFDATTYKLEIEWRLSAGDIAGAQISYNRIRAQEFEIEDVSPVINKLILAICTKNPLPYEDIMDLVGELTELNGIFSAELVSTLSKLHLQRGELHDLADLLRTHASSFTLAERQIVRSTFENYILKTDTAGGKWDGYTILRAIFPETTRETRLKIMQELFKVKRHDLAMHVFGHMRSSYLRERRPHAAAYIMLFEGIAFARKPPALDIAHNMLRLDVEVEPDTAIKTSLMLAYTMCDKPGKALAIWDDIMYSREGPSYDTINVALRACQEWHEGLEYTRNIWAQLQKQNVDIPKETADSYIAALAACGEVNEALETVVGLGKISGGRYQVDALT